MTQEYVNVTDRNKATLQQTGDTWLVHITHPWQAIDGFTGFTREFPSRQQAWEYARTWDETPATVR